MYSGLTCTYPGVDFIMCIVVESSFTDIDIDIDDNDKGPSISVINTAEHDDSGSSSGGGSEAEGDEKQKEEDDEKVNNGYVRVETKAVPTPQHPTKVMCSPERIQLPLVRHMDSINDAFSDDNSTRAELGSNPDDRSILSDTVEQPEAPSAVNMADTEAEVKATISTEAIVISSPTEDDDDDDHGAPKGVVVLPSSVAVTSTMSVVRPRSAPQSKLRRVLPADSDNCFTNHETTEVISRHQTQKSVPDVVNRPPKEMHKYSSLPAKSKYLGVDRAMEATNGHHGFTVLNSFKDSREAIDEIWKSVTLERSSGLEKTDEFVSSSSPSHHSSSSLAVNASDRDVSYENILCVT